MRRKGQPPARPDSAGPGIFYVAARTLAGDRAEGVASSFGTALGGMVDLMAAAWAFCHRARKRELFTALKLIGSAYLIWLGVRTFQSARRGASIGLNGETATPPVGRRRAFREGVLVEALNPKKAAFFLAFSPRLVDATEAYVALQFLAKLGVSERVCRELRPLLQREIGGVSSLQSGA